MALASGLSRAALLAAAGACVALACGTDTIDLLPERVSERAGSSSGGASAGQDGAGAGSATDMGGSTTQAGSNAEAGGGKSGGAAGSASCSGGPCGGNNSNTGGFDNGGGFGNGCPFGGCQSCFNNNQCPDWLHCSERFGNVCVECDDEVGCRPDQRCNLSIGRCAQVCEHNDECSEGRVCDPTLKACVFCTVDQQCLSDQNENTRRCVAGYCFECIEPSDCPKGPREICANWRCVECASDEDCGFDQHCDAGNCK
jgi:hypothetical protein